MLPARSNTTLRNIMRSVKAITYESFGGAEVLRVGERDLGELRPKDVRIKVAYSALNRADLLQVAGKYPNQKAPLPLGLEAAGEIESVGENVQGLKAGDRVMALLNGGGYAEMVDVPSGMCMKLPKEISTKKGAAIPETFLFGFE
jgi:NADPH:quinone reductase-like Zn-dependent oxidoreductase